MLQCSAVVERCFSAEHNRKSFPPSVSVSIERPATPEHPTGPTDRFVCSDSGQFIFHVRFRSEAIRVSVCRVQRAASGT